MISINNNKTEEIWFASVQKYLHWFVFFSIVPLIKIFGISITFFIFLIIVYKFLKKRKKLFVVSGWSSIFLVLFLIFVFIAALLTEDSFKDRSTFSIIKLTTQYIYWVIVAFFIKTWIYHFDFYKLSRVFFFSSVVTVIYYMTLNHTYVVFYPNVYAYTIVTVFPLGFYYVLKRFSISISVIIAIGFVMAVMISGSRTGTVLTLFEVLLILSLGNKQLKKVSIITSVISIPVMLIFFISFDSSDIRQLKFKMADTIEEYSPKIAHTLRMEENVFDRDKSLLIRKLMIQKSMRIFDEHPFFGVGPGNFTKYYTTLDIVSVSHWLHNTEDNYNQRSSQNSYIKILAEDGIFALMSFLIVFIIILWKGFYYYMRTFNDNIKIYIYIPFITLIFYGFILVTMQGALFWLLFGMALTLTQRKDLS